MAARVVTFIVWGLVAASAVFWGLRAGGAGPNALLHATAAPPFSPPQGPWTRVLGGAADPAAAGAALSASAAAERPGLTPGRLRLLGIVAGEVPRSAREGAPHNLALIALDDKPARTYQAGAMVEGDWVMQRIETRRVMIGPRGGAAAITLELPVVAPTAGGSAAGPAATPPPSKPGDGSETAEEDAPRPPRRTEPSVLRAPSPLNR